MLDLRPVLQLPRQVWWYLRSTPLTWLPDQCVAGGRYPRSAAQLHDLAAQGVRLIVNLHERPHAADLQVADLEVLHVAVRDFTAPSAEQLDLVLEAIDRTLSQGGRVVVHCGGGLGRTGTVLACYLVTRGQEPTAAIAAVRSVRPGSVETEAQVAAVRQFAIRLATRSR